MRPVNVFILALCLSGLLLSVGGCGQSTPTQKGVLDDRPQGWVSVPFAEGFTVDMPREPERVKGTITIPNVSEHHYVRFFVRRVADQEFGFEVSSYDATQEELQKRGHDARFDGWVRNQFPNWDNLQFKYRNCSVRGHSGKDWLNEQGSLDHRLIRTLAVVHGNLTKFILLRIDGRALSFDSPEKRWFFDSLRVP